MPVAEVLDAVFNLADEAGIGSHWCPGVGFDGSRGGAFMILLGTDDIGYECSTSFCNLLAHTAYLMLDIIPSSHWDRETSTTRHLPEPPSSSDSDSERQLASVFVDQ